MILYISRLCLVGTKVCFYSGLPLGDFSINLNIKKKKKDLSLSLSLYSIVAKMIKSTKCYNNFEQTKIEVS